MDFKKPTKIKRVSKVKKTKNLSKNEEARIMPALNGASISEKIDKVEAVVSGHVRSVFLDRFKNLRNVRRIVIFWLAIMAVLILLVGFYRFVISKEYSGEYFTEGGTYSEGIIGEVKSLNPLFATTNPEKAFEKLAFSQLYDIDTSGSLKGDLVEKITLSDNGYKDFKIKIIENAIWSDGEKLTADDVIFTINLLKDQVVNPSSYKSWKSVEVSKISDYEMSVKTATDSSSILYGLNFSIIPKHVFNNIATEKIREADFSKNPITSGTFNFKSLHVNGLKTTISLAQNEKYYKGSPKLEGFEIIAFDSEESLKKGLISGEVVASPDFKIGSFSDTEKAKFSEQQNNVSRGIYAFMNVNDSILKDIKVRQAIQIGVNMDEVRSKMSAVNKLHYPTLDKFLNIGDLSAPEYNFSEAEKILESAGWKKNSKGVREKDGVELAVRIATTTEENLKSASTEIKNQLEKLGFKVGVTEIDKNDKTGAMVQSILQPRNYSILVYEIDLGADADIYAFWHSSQTNTTGLNFSNYSDAVADDYLLNIRNAQTEFDKKDQATLFVKRWLKSAIALGVAQPKARYVFRNSAKTYSKENSLVSENDRYSDVIYWSVKKGTLYKTP